MFKICTKLIKIVLIICNLQIGDPSFGEFQKKKKDSAWIYKLEPTIYTKFLKLV